MAKKILTNFHKKPKVKRKGVHSKNNNTKKKYRGQGR